MKKFLKISELSTLLNLIDKKKNKPSNHILRYWEKEFKQIKPQVINKQRYYDTHQVEIIKLIKFLIKDKGMTINGVKTVLNSDKINKLDGYNSNGLKAEYYKKLLKEKSVTLLKKINNLKKYGKKNTSKS